MASADKSRVVHWRAVIKSKKSEINEAWSQSVTGMTVMTMEMDYHESVLNQKLCGETGRKRGKEPEMCYTKKEMELERVKMERWKCRQCFEFLSVGK